MTIDDLSWSPDASKVLGWPRRRREDRRLVTGRGRFVADLAPANSLHAAFVRSPVPHGVLRSVDTVEARNLPGVVEVLVADDLGLPELPPPPGLDRPDVTRPLLAGDRVRYFGEPVALVVADSQEAAADAAQAIWPEIDDLPPVLEDDDEQALFSGSNVVDRSEVHSDARIDGRLPISITIEVGNQRVAPFAIEGLAILCEPKDGRLHVTCGHQAPHRFREQLANAVGVGHDQVRVMVPDVGGAFGLKAMFFPEYAVVAAAARRLERPVLWLESRREHFVSGTHGRGQTHKIMLEGEASGRIRRARIEISADVGAYPHTGLLLPSLTVFMATGLYDIEDVSVSSSTMVTNRAPVGSYRGAGRPEAAYAIERAIDAFAREAGLDPAEVRRINFIRQDDLPYATVGGALYDSGDYHAALDRALELADEQSIRAEQKRRRETGEDPIGLGIGAFIERAGGPAHLGEFADVELTSSGEVIGRTGSIAGGQGHDTVWSQTLAEVLTVDPSRVRVLAGDTDEVADGVGTYGSRSAQAGASGLFRMAVSVRERARATAAEMIEAAPADLLLVDGAFRVAGVPSSDVPLAEVASYAGQKGIVLRDHEVFIPGIQTFPYGVHVAIVAVELDTGLVNLRRLIVVDDCGHVLNPMVVEGQVHGSVAQGIGQAMLEHVQYSGDGMPKTTTLMDYLVPAAIDFPEPVTDRLVHPAVSNPLGVKGTGEAGCIGAPPAIVNAVIDALAPYGVTNLQMPLRPERVWSAIQRAGGSPSD